MQAYQPFFLHSYVGIGSPWDLDRKNGGVFVLPPYTHDEGGETCQNLYAYRFKDYWRDVGTIESLWEANMDLLADRSQLDLYDPHWRT